MQNQNLGIGKSASTSSMTLSCGHCHFKNLSQSGVVGARGLRVQGHPGIHKETLSQQNKTRLPPKKKNSKALTRPSSLQNNLGPFLTLLIFWATHPRLQTCHAASYHHGNSTHTQFLVTPKDLLCMGCSFLCAYAWGTEPPRPWELGVLCREVLGKDGFITEIKLEQEPRGICTLLSVLYPSFISKLGPLAPSLQASAGGMMRYLPCTPCYAIKPSACDLFFPWDHWDLKIPEPFANVILPTFPGRHWWGKWMSSKGKPSNEQAKREG